MKKISLLFLAVFFIKTSNAQYTVIEGDSSNLENNISFIHIDTTVGNVWQIGSSQKVFFGASYSAPYSMMTDSINSYPTNNFSTFSVEFSDTNYWEMIPDAYIGFWHKYEMDSLKDGGYVEISLDSGATWENVANCIYFTFTSPAIIDQSNFYMYSDTIQGNIPAFTGTQANWMYSAIKLQWLFPVKQNIQDVVTKKVMFRFVFKSDNNQTNKAGWIIDNISIKIYDVGGGVNERALANFDVQVYANPIKEKGIIQVVPKNNEHDFSISIYNTIGQIITTSKMDKNNQYIINSNDLNSGIYFYSVKSKDGTFKSGKLIIK